MKSFPNEKVSLKLNVSDYFIDLYFPKHKLATEVDKKGRTDRNKKKENEREEK